MPRDVWRINNFTGGLNPFERVAKREGAFLRGVQLDFRSDPASLQLNLDEYVTSLPTTIGFSKWLVPAGLITPSLYSLDDQGYVKSRTPDGTYSNVTSHPSSAGHGIGYWRGDDFLYFAGYEALARYGPLATSNPTFQPSWQTLNADADYHPILSFRDFHAVGNGRHLAIYDGSEWDTDRVILPSGWRIRSLEIWNEYLAIGCWKGNSLDSHRKGIIFFWDGLADTYNFFQETDGAVAAMKNKGGQLYIVIGEKAELWKYNGALSKVTDLYGANESSDYVDVFPGSVDTRNNLLLIGVAGYASTASLAKGVYSWGSTDDSLPDGLNHEYLGSGNVSETFQNNSNHFVGALGGLGDTTLVATKDSSAPNNRILEIDTGGSTVTNRGGRYESLVYTAQQPNRKKKLLKFIANFSPIPSGVTYKFFYKIDDEDWTLLGTEDTQGEVEFEQRVDPLPIEFRELQLACEFNQASSGDQPRLYSMISEVEIEEQL